MLSSSSDTGDEILVCYNILKYLCANKHVISPKFPSRLCGTIQANYICDTCQ
jgi:hypothetical protein